MAGYGGDEPQRRWSELSQRVRSSEERKDWACADALRDGLAELGVLLLLSASEPVWVRKG